MCTFSHAYVLFHTSLCRNYSTDIRVRAGAATLSHSAFLQLRTENLFSLCQANIESVKALYFQEIKKGINSLHQVDLHQFAKTSCQSLKKKIKTKRPLIILRVFYHTIGILVQQEHRLWSALLFINMQSMWYSLASLSKKRGTLGKGFPLESPHIFRNLDKIFYTKSH